MKRLIIVAWLQMSNRASRDKLASNAVFLFKRQGFRVEFGGSYEQQNLFAPLGYYSQPIYRVQVVLIVPNNYSIFAIRSSAVRIFSQLGKVVSVNAQLGIDDGSINAENSTNAENDIEVLEEPEEKSSYESVLYVAGGFFLGWLVSRN